MGQKLPRPSPAGAAATPPTTDTKANNRRDRSGPIGSFPHRRKTASFFAVGRPRRQSQTCRLRRHTLLVAATERKSGHRADVVDLSCFAEAPFAVAPDPAARPFRCNSDLHSAVSSIQNLRRASPSVVVLMWPNCNRDRILNAKHNSGQKLPLVLSSMAGSGKRGRRWGNRRRCRSHSKCRGWRPTPLLLQSPWLDSLVLMRGTGR